ncbi:hypothetical protein PGUG_05780 [Meyerozyma guilliermondii ATCC 6260]|uniref:Uncharacterized protein n=1 Tax=Meyerozyma guilliermondii (strain ATCC 6260 / CBS 566 / DSM 6381 / JCM 1539 / NBRC 10279 / NRRL Y-324) TaxID=294746 RepID=A5DR79_PICGU|nr:uncharacterized protein PGUG_05780 [Meyerozyma guilliermondii ATCC 6260]EDK41682.2 hypothetical protein PGUG_05780 [Meyerozyma guilliermondii ATCC 6260]
MSRERAVSVTKKPTKPSLGKPHSESVVPTINTVSDLPPKRLHSQSISSVLSNDSHTDVSVPYPASRGKIQLMDDEDLEKQMIITAGGKREHVTAFVVKLLFLTTIVIGSGVLVFYAL